MLDEQISVELLCGHHLLDRFDCGDEESNTLAAGLVRQTREGRQWRYYDSFLAVVVVEQAEFIIGIAAACTLNLISDEDADGRPVEGKCLFYYLLAADRSHASRMGALKRLLEEMDDIQSLLVPSGGYIGEIAMPDRAGDPVQRKRLIGWLERQGFRPLGSKPYLWFRPS